MNKKPASAVSKPSSNLSTSMPNYDYKCLVCNSIQEVQRQLGEDREPSCCGTSMERVWTATPAIFKTGGFYKTGG